MTRSLTLTLLALVACGEPVAHQSQQAALDREFRGYTGDTVHRVRLGFAMDTLAETQLYAGPMQAAYQALQDEGMVSANALPDLCVNQIFKDGFHPCRMNACRAQCGCTANATPWPVIPADPACCPGLGLGPQVQDLLGDWNLLVTLSNLPYVSDYAGYQQGNSCVRVAPGDPTQANHVAQQVSLPGIYPESVQDLLDETAWTSFPPVFDDPQLCADSVFGEPEWMDYLEALHEGFTGQPGEIAYETGNEPEARRFFWGDASDFAGKSASIYDALRRKGPRPDVVARPSHIFFGGFTGQTLSGLASGEPAADANAAAFFDEYSRYRDGGRDTAHTPSFHVFRQIGWGENQDPDLPTEKRWSTLQARADTLDLRGGAISAFNLYARAHECGSPWREDLIESDYFSYELAELLLFAHRTGLARIYMWKLLDFADEPSRLGFFDEAGQPKESFRQLARVWRVIRSGYRAYELQNPRRIRIVGEEGEIFEASMAPLGLPPKVSVEACPERQVRCLPEHPDLRANICALYEGYDWAIYRDDGKGKRCGGALVEAGAPRGCDAALPCPRRPACAVPSPLRSRPDRP